MRTSRLYLLVKNLISQNLLKLQPMIKWLYLSTCAKELSIYMQNVCVML